jgi:hypothetical protein
MMSGYTFHLGSFLVFKGMMLRGTIFAGKVEDMRKRISLWSSLLIIAPLLLFVPSIWAADFLGISTSDLKNKLDAKEKFLLVNALSDIEFNLEHIPGSVNIPVGEIQTTDKLPQDKETLIVFY